MVVIWVMLALTALAGAWYAGFRMRPEDDSPRKLDFHRDYLVGLNFLLNEETDKAVDVFIKMLEVDSDTVETHLAVGKLFRKRGEVDRAIRIHQNLIARPQLEKIYREQSLFELGQDYLSAGMIDRAEKYFLELVNEKDYASDALETLIEIYQQGKDWPRAIDMAQQYQSVTKKSLGPEIAHFYCELAEIAINKKMYREASGYLDKAAYEDSRCARASLLHAKVLMAEGDNKTALRYLKNVKDQNPDYLAESIEMIATCYERLHCEDQLITYFKNLIDEYPRVPVVLILAERIRKWKGDKTAAGFVADYVRRYPSLKGIALFINIYISNAEGRAKEDMHILQNLMKKILANKPEYKCNSCGFPGKTLHWQCPGCREWSTMVPIYNLEDGLA
ncbi:MAG TPA: lipopolysaccharide assembly protein LapB [Gammaproteobacteria bacterium]|jgi:lipopolysaccharide biosynthesis regulator YciM|nr:lipopolysaccharide assembly protein LapB [Gammaproteobacteria bacterium]